MRTHRIIGTLVALSCVGGAAAGCQAQATLGVEPAIGGCGQDPTVDCSGGGWGYSCDPSDNPEDEDASLSCSVPTPDPNGNDDYCCFAWSPEGGGSTCTPDDGLTAACPDPDSYGYTCSDPGDDPTSLDPNLHCSQGVVDPDGTDTDFCCNYGAPYGGGGGSTCVPDDAVTSGCPNPSSDGYQCDTGDDPTSLDPSLSCSGNTPDPDGVHDDYCCTQ